ncbi:MAG TPA: hypothetical protein VMD91_12385 [Candidatus Sulfotelmatobacter sp.]|nr:hypothetical protein [Candidatus Sulfotelmatobacter sp.]
MKTDLWCGIASTTLAVLLWIAWGISHRAEPGLWGPVLVTLIALVFDVRYFSARRKHLNDA